MINDKYKIMKWENKNEMIVAKWSSKIDHFAKSLNQAAFIQSVLSIENGSFFGN